VDLIIHLTVHETASIVQLVYPATLRIRFKNGTGQVLQIESGRWNSGSEGVPSFFPSQAVKWQIKRGDEEKEAIKIPIGSEFRTWIGLNDSVDGTECLTRCALKRTGTLHLELRIGIHALEHEFHF
jgi:hypothetical protein